MRQTENDGEGSRSTWFEFKVFAPVLGVLIVLAVPALVKVCKRSLGNRILQDCRQMDAAIDRWALENSKGEGDQIDTTAVQTYLNRTWKQADPLGNPYVVALVGPTQISISAATKAALAGAGIDWGSY